MGISGNLLGLRTETPGTRSRGCSWVNRPGKMKKKRGRRKGADRGIFRNRNLHRDSNRDRESAPLKKYASSSVSRCLSRLSASFGAGSLVAVRVYRERFEYSSEFKVKEYLPIQMSHE